MHISPASLLSLVVWGSLMMVVLYLVSSIPSQYHKLNSRFMIWLLGISFLRFLFPISIPFQLSIPIAGIFRTVLQFLQRDVSLFRWSFEIYQALLFLWFSVAVVLVLRIILQYVCFRKAVKSLLCCSHTCRLRTPHGLDLPDSLMVYESVYAPTPMITGIFKPVVILPALSLSEEEISLILRHELQHYKYRDILLKVCVELCCILYWWNPVVHMLKQRLLLLLEIRADSEVYGELGKAEKVAYLECLQRLCNHECRGVSFGAAFASARRKSSILERARYLTKEKLQKLPVGGAILFSILLLCSLVLVFEPHIGVHKDRNITVAEGVSKDSYLIMVKEDQYEIYTGEQYLGTVFNPYESGVDALPIYRYSRDGVMVRDGMKEDASAIALFVPALFILLFWICIGPEVKRRMKLF